MSDKVPFASSEWRGTTVLKTCSPIRRSSETRLPFWRSCTKPARFSALITLSPETLGSFGMSSGDFDGRPERLAFCGTFRSAPCFEVKFDRLAQTGSSRFDVFALRRHVELRAPGDVPAVFFGNERGEAVSHRAMLTKLL